MAGNMTLSYSCVVLACVGNATANVLQRKASLSQPEQPFGPRLLLALVRSPIWLTAFGSLVASFVLQAVALRFAPLSAVEPIITLEVPLTLLIASRVFPGRLSSSDWASILLMTAGMAALVGGLGPAGGNADGVDHLTYIEAGAATAAGIAALVVAGQRAHRVWRAAALGAAAGTSFGMTATMIKATMAAVADHGFSGIVLTWQTYVAMGFGIGGLVLVQAALHAGPLVAAQPGFTLMDPLVSILWGVLIFDEVTRTGGWLVLATVGAIAIGVAVFRLARSPLLQQVVDVD
jgi:drug/metabolite transporter (DMT)-like permease